MILGIDLGTTHSLVGRFHRGEAELAPNANGEFLTPSVVSIDDEGVLHVGSTARNRLITHPHLTASEFKRFMGTEKTFSLGGHTFDATDLSSLVLKELKGDAERFFDATSDTAFISVPAYFNNKQRQATKRAAELAGFKQIRLINEPTAAALAYGVDGHREDEAHYIVLDLGGGTFDVSLLEVFNGVFEIHASAGDNFLGGKDFTQAIIDDLVSTNNVIPESLTRKDHEKLYSAANRAKHRLSEHHIADITVHLESQSIDYRIDRDHFTDISDGLLKRIRHPLNRVLSDSGYSSKDIDGIILVGGSTRMHPFRSLVSRLFGQIPRSDYHPDQAIAIGTALQAGLASSEDSIEDLVLTDVCPYTLGVAVLGSTHDLEFMPIIERNRPIPTSETRSLSPSHSEQKQVAIKVYQGESFLPEHNLYLGVLEVDLPEPGTDRSFRLTYTYDLDGTLQVEVTIPAIDQVYRGYIRDGERVDDEKLEEQFARLAELKVLPRDQKRNRELLSRLESLFEENIGDRRAHAGDLLRHFYDVLKSHDTKKIDEAADRIRQALGAFDEREFL